MPVAWLPMPSRPPSSAVMATLKPPPGSPSRFSAGTSQSSNDSDTVFDERMPILSSSRPTLNPGRSGVITSVDSPRVPGPSPVRANRMITLAKPPEVIHIFSPFTTKRSPRRSARVFMAPGSEPAPASLSANEPAMASPDVIIGMYFSRCAGVPNFKRISAAMLVTDVVTATAASTRASSWIARL